MSQKNVAVLFVDIRGFTQWSRSPEVFPSIAEFVDGFLVILKEQFPAPEFMRKPLGDGAMIVREIAPRQNAEAILDLLQNLFERIERVKKQFDEHCASYARQFGEATTLRLGWGITRGFAIESNGDYLGHNINKSARLCDAARPFGIVVERDDFQDLPAGSGVFVEQVRKLTGFDDVRVWVTEEIASQFLSRELLRQTPEVHVAGMCVDRRRSPLKILIARRSATRRLYPNLWEGCGGQLTASEEFAEGVVRHFRFEMGIDVRVLPELHLFYSIREPNIPVIPGIRFVCERMNETQPRSTNHSELRWVTEPQLKAIPDMEFIPGLKSDYLKLLRQLRKQSTARKKQLSNPR